MQRALFFAHALLFESFLASSLSTLPSSSTIISQDPRYVRLHGRFAPPTVLSVPSALAAALVVPRLASRPSRSARLLALLILCTHIQINSKDSRYARFHGRSAQHPFHPDRRLPIVLDDELVDMNFGTGAVKITPGLSLCFLFSPSFPSLRLSCPWRCDSSVVLFIIPRFNELDPHLLSSLVPPSLLAFFSPFLNIRGSLFCSSRMVMNEFLGHL